MLFVDVYRMIFTRDTSPVRSILSTRTRKCDVAVLEALRAPESRALDLGPCDSALNCFWESMTGRRFPRPSRIPKGGYGTLPS